MTFGKSVLESKVFDTQKDEPKTVMKNKHKSAEENEQIHSSIRSNFNSTRNTKGLIREIESLDEEILVIFQFFLTTIVPAEKLDGSFS